MSTATGVRREVAACSAIARLAWQTRANQGSNALTWILIAAAVFVPIAAGAMSGKWARSVGFGAGIPLLVMTALWWNLLVMSLGGQNRPGARLVPAVARRSVAVLVCCWTGLTLVLTLLFSLAGWPPLLCGVGTALALTMVAEWILAPALAWVFYLLVMVPLLMGDRLKALFPFSAAQNLMWGGPVLTVLLGYATLRALYQGVPTPADAFFGTGKQLASYIDSIKPAILKGKPGATSSFSRILKRDCAEVRIPALLLHAFGFSANMPTARSFVTGAAVALGAGLLAPGWIARYHDTLQMLIPALMVALQVVMASSLVQAVYKTRREQGLVRLAPRMPAGTALNALLARSLLLAYGHCWLGSSSLALLLLYFLGVPTNVLLRVLAVFLMTLTWANLLLRDYASERSGNGSALVRMLVMLGACVLTLAAAQVEFFHSGPWLVMGCATLAVGLAIAWQRWHAMLRAAPAFPAARAR